MFLVYDPNLLDEGQNQLAELNGVQTTVAISPMRVNVGLILEG